MPLQKTTFAEALGLNLAGDDQLRFLGEAAYRWFGFGQLDRAAAIFEGLTVLAPNHPAGPLGLTEVFLAQKKFQEAVEAGRAALKKEHLDRPTMAYAYVLLGQAQVGLNKLPQARKAWETALELESDGPTAELAREGLRALPPDTAAAS